MENSFSNSNQSDKRRVGFAFILAVALESCVITELRAQVVVVPNANATNDGNSSITVPAGPLGQARVMLILDASQFGSLSGPSFLTQFVRRADTISGPSGPRTQALRVYASTTSRSVAGMSTTFSENIGTNNTLVFDGTETLSTQNLPGPGNTREFDIVTRLTTPFLYDPAAGNLLVEVQYFSDDGQSLRWDAVTADPFVRTIRAPGSPTAPTGSFIQSSPVYQFTFAATNFVCINYKESLPPLSIESRTNVVRLRFAGNPTQKFTIERAPALSDPWTTLTTQTATASALLQYDDTNPPPTGAFYRTAYTNSGILMRARDLPVTSKLADYQIPYGPSSAQRSELWVPAGDGPHPVVILIHGGCWKYSSLRSLAPMADALKSSGFATLNIEYRDLRQAGGGWPGTYLDVGTAVDQLRTLTSQHRLDLSRVIVMGHSAGGHLAMWVAARSRLPVGTPLYVANPLPVRGVINLAGTGDMEAFIPLQVQSCQSAVVYEMLGGTPAQFPERYAQASAIKMLPIGTPQVLIWGDRDDILPLSIGQDYARAATAAGDPVLLIVFPRLGHFEIASPFSPCWPVVRSAVECLLKN